MSIHAGQVQRCVSVVVLGLCVGLVVQKQQLEERWTADQRGESWPQQIKAVHLCIFLCVYTHWDALVSSLAGHVQWCEGVVVCGVNWSSFMHQQVDQLGLTCSIKNIKPCFACSVLEPSLFQQQLTTHRSGVQWSVSSVISGERCDDGEIVQAPETKSYLVGMFKQLRCLPYLRLSLHWEPWQDNKCRLRSF